MPVIDLPGGKSAQIVLLMADFRELWNAGEIQRLEQFSTGGGDFGEMYHLMTRIVRRWDCTDLDGQPLDPHVSAEYDQLEAPTFIALVKAVSAYIADSAAAGKNSAGPPTSP